MNNINEFSKINYTENFTCDNQEGLLLNTNLAKIFLFNPTNYTWVDFGNLIEQRIKNIHIFSMYEAYLLIYKDGYSISEEIQNFIKAFVKERNEAYAAIVDANLFDEIVLSGTNLTIGKVNYHVFTNEELIKNYIDFDIKKLY